MLNAGVPSEVIPSVTYVAKRQVIIQTQAGVSTVFLGQ